MDSEGYMRLRLLRDALNLAAFVVDCVPEDLPDEAGGERTRWARRRAAQLIEAHTIATEEDDG